MSDHSKHDQARDTSSAPRRARFQALLFTAGSIGTTLLTLGLLGDVKLPKVQGE